MTREPVPEHDSARPATEDVVLFDSTPTRVCRTRTAEGRQVVSKSLRDHADPAGAAASIRHEFEIARRIRSDHVIEVYGIEVSDDDVTLVLEDFGGRSLDQLMRERPFTLRETLGIGVQVARGLDDLHAADVIHKDITPANIVYNPDNGIAKIIDFGISSYLTREQADLCAPALLEGSLPYLSPEQTGRMNRAVDYRSDFYALGATLYELLTGAPLFDVTEPMDWLHCHIAREPRPPHRVRREVPTLVSELVMTLLRKNADDRYRSAAGIAADLARLLERLDAGEDQPRFPLGTQDLPRRFQIPQRLYGREPHVERLMAVYDRASRGPAELALVAGYSGIGKTSVIKELYRPITARRGFFVSGKFDQLHRHVPLSAPVAALKALVRQLLTEPETTLAGWRDKLDDALEGQGALIVELIPELALIIGDQPPLPPMPQANAERRFRRAMRRFVAAFCRAEHPLVLFLDDLQWADAATLELLELILVEAPVEHLLVIGAYRDNETGPGHPLLLAVERLRQSVPVTDIDLPPLAAEDLRALLADALHADAEAVARLADTVAAKTGGNPYFTEEFLKDLVRQGLVGFDGSSQRWRWDDAEIAAQRVTDNVVDLMSAKLRRLSDGARHTLEIAACIGHRFELELLARVDDTPWPALLDALREAMAEQLIAPLGGQIQKRLARPDRQGPHPGLEFAFAHDRIQQSAHGLLEPEALARIHLRIGRLLQATPQARGEGLFRVTDHLNAARPLIDGPDGTRELRDLNLAAGRRARDAAAHEAADAYLRAAVDLVAERDWQSALAEVLRIHAEAAESACAVGDYPRCDALLERALDAAAAPEHTTLLNRVKLDSLSAQGRHTEALDLGRALLAERGRRYPARPGRRHALAAFARLRWRMRDVSLDTLRALPDLVDPEMVHEMAIGERLGAAAAFAQPELLPLLACRGAEAALTHGVSERTMVTFGGIGVLLCTTFGRVEAAEKYNRFALELTDRFPDDPARGRVQLHHAAFVQPWMTPLEETLEPLTRAYEACFACGDWDGAAQAVTYRASYLWLSGRSLATVIKDVDQWRSAIADLNQVEAVQYIDALHQHLLNLTGQADDPARLKGSSYDIDVMLPEHERTASRRMLNAAHGRQAMLKYQFGDPAGALPHADLVREHLPGFEHIFDGLMIHYFDALTRLAVAATASGRARRRLLRQVQASRRQIGRWAERAPFNALAKKLTVDAEWHRIHGREDRAQTLYDAAVDAARRHDMPSDEAIANRLAGEMHHAAGRATIAEAYLTKACHAYRRWGGDALADYLEQRHPAIARRRAAVPAAERSQRGTDASTHLNQIDLSALMKALRAIAGERVHSRMVQTIIDTAMAFAGAQHGVLLLRDADGGLRIEAEATVDGGPSQILQSLPIEDGSPLCRPVVNYVARARRGIVIHDAAEPAEAIPGVTRDAHVVASGVRSILCLPIIAATEQINTLIGMLYLENRRTSHTFTEARFETLEIICMAAAGRLELSRKAAVDGLTGLFNRDYFQTMLRQEFLNSQRHGRDLAVILADIDHFKGFNDTWGHQLGDEVLQAVAAAVRGACRESDVAARYGGEELAVILPNTDAQGAVEAAERIRAAVEAVRIEHGGEALSVTLSAGVAALRHGTGSEDELLRQADAALYDAKRAGRNRVQIA